MTDSIIVFGRVCPSIGRHQEAYRYSDRVILSPFHSESLAMTHGGKFRALIYAEPFGNNETETQKRQSALAYAVGSSYEHAIHALARRLHELADELVKEPPAL